VPSDPSKVTPSGPMKERLESLIVGSDTSVGGPVTGAVAARMSSRTK
jgi:hypothetical protein